MYWYTYIYTYTYRHMPLQVIIYIIRHIIVRTGVGAKRNKERPAGATRDCATFWHPNTHTACWGHNEDDVGSVCSRTQTKAPFVFGSVGLFCGYIGLFCGYICLFCGNSFHWNALIMIVFDDGIWGSMSLYWEMMRSVCIYILWRENEGSNERFSAKSNLYQVPLDVYSRSLFSTAPPVCSTNLIQVWIYRIKITTTCRVLYLSDLPVRTQIRREFSTTVWK